MSAPTQAELRQANDFGAMIATLQGYDVVVALLPNGTEVLIKGRDFLDVVIAGNQPRAATKVTINVLSAEMAAALDRALGNDGAFSAPSHTGHA